MGEIKKEVTAEQASPTFMEVLAQRPSNLPRITDRVEIRGIGVTHMRDLPLLPVKAEARIGEKNKKVKPEKKKKNK